jgi:arsenate reductase
MQLHLYGIPNCDTVKKARTWLQEQGLPFEFHDFKKEGLTRPTVAAWLADLDWQLLVNRKGTTWRQLPDARRARVLDSASALELMLESPSVIKRPVLCGAGRVQVGFSAAQYQQTFQP